MADFPSRKDMRDFAERSKDSVGWSYVSKLTTCFIEAMDLLALQATNFRDLDGDERLTAEQRIEDILRRWEDDDETD